MTPEEKMRRAEEADRLLKTPILVEAFEAIERAQFETALAAETPEIQRAALDRVHAIRSLRQHLRSVVTDGQQAARKPPSVA